MQIAQAPTRDFTIPPPTGARPVQPNPAVQPSPPPSAPTPRQAIPSVPPPTASPQQGTATIFPRLPTAPSNTEMAVGAGIVVVLATVFFFVRGAVKSHLVRRRATVDAASGAAWMLFAALFLTSLTVVSGTIGHVWGEWIITVPALVICVIAFLIFFVLFARAPSHTR